MKLRPFADRIVVRVQAEKEMTAGGLIIPDTAQEKSGRGEVLAVGEGRYVFSDEAKAPAFLEPRVAVGQLVLFGKFDGVPVDVDGEKLLLLREDDILGVFEP